MTKHGAGSLRVRLPRGSGKLHRVVRGTRWRAFALALAICSGLVHGTVAAAEPNASPVPDANCKREGAIPTQIPPIAGSSKTVIVRPPSPPPGQGGPVFVNCNSVAGPAANDGKAAADGERSMQVAAKEERAIRLREAELELRTKEFEFRRKVLLFAAYISAALAGFGMLFCLAAIIGARGGGFRFASHWGGFGGAGGGWHMTSALAGLAAGAVFALASVAMVAAMLSETKPLPGAPAASATQK